MSFIDDMKVGKKLMGGFLIVLLILVVVAALGYMNLQDAATRQNALYEKMQGTENLALTNAALEKMRGDIYRYIAVPADRQVTSASLAAQVGVINDNMAEFRTRPLTNEDKFTLDTFDKAWATMQVEYTKIEQLTDAGDMAAVDAGLAAGSPAVTARTECLGAVKTLVTSSFTQAKDLNNATNAAAASASLVMLIATIVAVIVGLGIALYLSKSITAPIDQVASNLKELSKGHLGNRMKMNRKDEIGEMAETMDKFSDNLQGDVVGAMKMIADGDLSMEVKVADAQDEIGPALRTTIESLRLLVTEANMLSKSAVAGQLSVRGNTDKFKGGYKDVIRGINETLDGVVLPVNEAMHVSNEYASGNFTARFDEKLIVQGDMIKFKDALNNIGIQVAKALSSINQQVGDLAASAEEANASVEEVSAGSAQVAKNASGVSVNAEKATQGVEQVQKAMEDLSRTIQDVATKSEAVAKIVQDTTTFSKEGMELAQKTEQGMQGITKSSNDVNQIIGEIKDQMDKISEIVNLITDLANQTNLLALNAAIEAARAGDAGRGFAVVATEVKSLAVESRTSAERIAEMIANLQKQTLDAVDAVTASNNGVKEGSAALQETLSSFNKIVIAIDKISQNVSEVAAAAEEQAASVEEVTASVNEVGGLMQNTTSEATDAAAASEESSAAIDQISKVVANLNIIVEKVTKEVSRFRV
ncbi:MAG: methyl-accepting chemotaxis protein [Methanoregula sp.]|jgi:methyl-accepting chemotaxis protein|nr:methyl-accepting chemotaxis protein [Methanoregula sp.]